MYLSFVCNSRTLKFVYFVIIVSFSLKGKGRWVNFFTKDSRLQSKKKKTYFEAFVELSKSRRRRIRVFSSVAINNWLILLGHSLIFMLHFWPTSENGLDPNEMLLKASKRSLYVKRSKFIYQIQKHFNHYTVKSAKCDHFLAGLKWSHYAVNINRWILFSILYSLVSVCITGLEVFRSRSFEVSILDFKIRKFRSYFQSISNFFRRTVQSNLCGPDNLVLK